MYEVKITSGEYAGQFVSVASFDAALKEFGRDRIDVHSIREESPLFRVIVATPDGDDVDATLVDLTTARAAVAEYAKQGRSAWYEQC